MSDAAPDPSELEPLTEDEAVYQRDEAGDLIPQAHPVNTSKGWRRVEIEPVSKGEALRLEERFGDRDELDVEDLDGFLNEKVVEPDMDWADPDIDPGVYVPVLSKVVEVLTGVRPSNQFHAEVVEELELRSDKNDDDAGN